MNGLAVVYSDKLSGQKTASGQKFCQTQMTAAHRSLPLGTKVRVTNIRNSKSVEVSINDRGPRHAGRVIDLSTAAAMKIGMNKTGKSLVKLEIVSEASAKKS
jgi:rare lipoprotein A